MGIFDFLKHQKAQKDEKATDRGEHPPGVAGRMAAPSQPAVPHSGPATTHTPPEAAKRSAPPQHEVLRGPMPQTPETPHVVPGTAKRSAPPPPPHEDDDRKRPS
ncbi:hypothetical protein ACM614_29545 [Streptomyces sp. 12297]|uniref:hypothetical protein n=1 Tax=Streptomyces sp. NBC_00239 TaxID=2903640 RepID=UPI002E2D9C61|nr:hypothetical protein [Streptomyces sp. NBC_00239]